MFIQQINTKVCIIGAGAAGLVTANILHKYGISCIVIEQHSQTEIYARSRTDLIDYKTAAILQEHGLSDRLLRLGKPHGQCEFRTPEGSFILDYASMSGGQTHYLYPHQELLADLIDRYQDNLPLRNYSATWMLEIRSTQEFSESFFQMINTQTDIDSEEINLLQLLQKFKLSQLMNSVSYAREFAKMYVGYSTSDRLIIKPPIENHDRLPVAQKYPKLKPLVIVS